MNRDEEITDVVNKIAKIMYENPEVFWISKILSAYGKKILKLKGEYLSLYVEVSIRKQFNIGYIVKQKIDALEELWWSIEKSALEEAKQSVIKSVLIMYTEKIMITGKNVTAYKNMLIKYGFNV